MKVWDPHFHIWDLRPDTQSGHDAAQLFAPHGNPLYSMQQYEADLQMDGFELIGGTFVEAVSVCHLGQGGEDFAQACLAEAQWVSAQCAQSERPYRLVASAPLESAAWPPLLEALQALPGVVGIRQILNHEPSWPRNRQLGDLLDSPAWREGFARLSEAGYSFDLQCNPHQHLKAANFLQQHPQVPVILNHLGTPTQEDLTEGTRYWEGMGALAELPQVSLKLSMLSYPQQQWDQSRLVTDAVLRAIELFGVERCMFASNFPVELPQNWPAPTLYRAFRQLVQEFSLTEQQSLFAENAQRVYRVEC